MTAIITERVFVWLFLWEVSFDNFHGREFQSVGGGITWLVVKAHVGNHHGGGATWSKGELKQQGIRVNRDTTTFNREAVGKENIAANDLLHCNGP